MKVVDLFYPDEWTEYHATVPPVTLDDYEGPEDGKDDEPIDPRDEYDDRNSPSGYDHDHWIF